LPAFIFYQLPGSGKNTGPDLFFLPQPAFCYSHITIILPNTVSKFSRNGLAPWKLGIADPRGDHQPFATLELGDGTLSTSGDYERSFMKDGVRYHHLLDPDFGEPARGCRSVTIVANRAITADLLSTGVFIMGPDAGMALIEQLPDVEGVIVTADNEVLISSGLKNRLTMLAPPTDAP
jgi:thiamine biosynthesis lipoprotein